MNWKVEYKDDDLEKILTRTFSGKVTMSSIISSWKDVLTKKLITEGHKGVISDYRGTDILVSEEDIVTLEKFFQEHIEIFRNLRMAQLVDTPKIIYPILFNIGYPNFHSKPFSTIEAAKMWIIVECSNK